MYTEYVHDSMTLHQVLSVLEEVAEGSPLEPYLPETLPALAGIVDAFPILLPEVRRALSEANANITLSPNLVWKVAQVLGDLRQRLQGPGTNAIVPQVPGFVADAPARVFRGVVAGRGL